jgi:hypothetical protein
MSEGFLPDASLFEHFKVYLRRVRGVQARSCVDFRQIFVSLDFCILLIKQKYGPLQANREILDANIFSAYLIPPITHNFLFKMMHRAAASL